MKIAIVTMEDPVFTVDFNKSIVKNRPRDICGILIVDGGRMVISKKKSRLAYLLSLLLIMGPKFYIASAFKRVTYRIRKSLSARIQRFESLPLEAFARERNIDVIRVQRPDDPVALDWLNDRAPDVIVHQSQNILKRTFLDIPNIGVVNRHNALLPHNRGRLTPFWVLYRNESETGVSIHWVTEKIDEGEIIYQERFSVDPGETFESLVRKNYTYAERAIQTALDLIESGKKWEPGPDLPAASYNSTPSMEDAMRYRMKRIKKSICRKY